MQAHLDAGQFPPGNMGPKIESALRFLRAGGREVIITSYEHLCDAVEGSGGTHVVADQESTGPARLRQAEPALVR
jgi:carbamate kinase